MKTFADICVSDITVISGVRPGGRTTDHSAEGRLRNGFFYMFRGEARFWTQEKQLMVKPGQLVFIPQSYRYKMQYTAPETAFVLVNFHMFDKTGTPLRFSETIEPLAEDSLNRLGAIMSGFERCDAAWDSGAHFRRKELLYRLFGELFRGNAMSPDQHPEYPQLVAGVLLLEQSYLENLPVARFAEACGISISSFRSLSGKQYGMSPIQYRNRLRIERAMQLLSEGSCTVSEAAYACGFENIGYFCRYYKKHTGETPLQTKHRLI
jgi:AraC-like DNA-binding protein